MWKAQIACARLTIALLALFAQSAPARPVDTSDDCAGLHVQRLIGRTDERKFDPATGRDTRHFPPDPQVNYTHVRLDIRMEDPLSRSFKCDQTLSFRTPQRTVERIDLDAVNLKIESVTDLQGGKLSYRYDDRKLTIRFNPPLAAESDLGLKISYSCVKPVDGMHFALPDEGYPNRPVSIHTQGEAELNRYWFVAHDYPNARQTSEVLVTIPARYVALSNGKLVTRAAVGNGMVRYHYALSKPHVNYLISLVVGEFAIVRETWRDRPVEYWVPPSQEKDAKRTFGKTPAMMEFFSKRLGYDYPWEKYAQSVVYNFAFGGMENTSATTLVETSTLDERAALDNDIDGLIAHELAHQWFGDLVTCNSWPHIWLNEGFATYMEATWREHDQGPEYYAHEMWNQLAGVASSDDVTARGGGLVWTTFADPEDVFGRGVSNPYGKGASVLHMLRRSLGDELFWKVLSTYLKRHEFRTVETDDLRKVCEELSGRSYERFFHQWVYRPGSPHVTAKYSWDDEARTARVTLEQTQPMSVEAPAFLASVPVWFVNSAGQVVRKATISVDSRFSEITERFEQEDEPEMVVVDPEGALLAKWDNALPVGMLLKQAKSGPTPWSRFAAIAALADDDRDDVRELLKGILLDEKQHWTFRTSAADALGKMQVDEARDLLLAALAEDKAVAEPRVRRSAVAALGGYRSAKAVPTLIRFAGSDPSYSVEKSAVQALGKQESTQEIVDALISASKKSGGVWQDGIRDDALGALTSLGAAQALPLVMERGAYGQPFRSRSSAIESAARLANELDADKNRGERVRVREYLLGLLNDKQDRSVEAAIRALGVLGDDKAVAPLQAIADGSGRAEHRSAARTAIDEINRKSGEPASVRALRERVESLEKAREEDQKSMAAPAESKDRAPAPPPPHAAPATQP